MKKENILELIVKNICEVMPELETHDFQQDDSLKNLGANSIDRVEIVMMTMEALSLEIPKEELLRVKNIGELSNLFYEKFQTV
jgi:polyketide biosynthesis acyl carrier protein